MGQVRDPQDRKGDELEEALHRASDAARRDPHEADIAADDAGGQPLAEALDAEDEAQAHPS